MAEVEIDLGNWADWQSSLEKFIKADQAAILRQAAKDAGAKFDQIVRSELPPPRRPLKAAQRWTAKQRRWWWATMHTKAQGQSEDLPGWKAFYKKVGNRNVLVLKGFYRRTGTLVKSLTYRVKVSGDMTVDVAYGTNRDYARFVIDDDKQSWYHKGNWKTLQQIALSEQAQVRKTFEVSMQQGIARRLGG